MAKSKKPEVGRRKFLKNAAAGAAALAAHPISGQPQQSANHDHEHQFVPSDPALRVKTLESLLVEKGLVDPQAVDALIDTYEHKVGPRNGASVVAKVWTDPAYRSGIALQI